MIQEGYRHPRAAAGFAWAREWRREGLRELLYAWRWPAGLLAAVILWLALVTVVGAATFAPRVDAESTPGFATALTQAQQVLRAGPKRL